MSTQHTQDMLLFLVLVVNSDWFGATCSYSSCLFSCALDFVTFRLETNVLYFILTEQEWLLLHQVQHYLFPGRCIRQRNVEPLHKPSSRSFINLLRSFRMT